MIWIIRPMDRLIRVLAQIVRELQHINTKLAVIAKKIQPPPPLTSTVMVAVHIGTARPKT